jgi:antitoxin YefM
MDTITYSDARANLAKTMDRVCDDHAPVVITRENGGAVVMLSLRDYEGLEETAYLLSSPANARRLLESVGEIEAGGGERR